MRKILCLPLARAPFLRYNTAMKKFLRNQQNKTALVTGASSGIGKELCRLLVLSGFTVVGVARSNEKLSAVQLELGEAFLPFSGDVSKKETWAMISRFLKGRGITTLSLFISCAGILPPFASVKTAKGEGVMQTENAINTNFLAAVYGTEAMLPFVTKGAVYISSSASLCTLPGVSGYAASKSALSAYVTTLQAEKTFPYVGLMLPGFTKTEVFRAQTGTDKRIDRICMPAPKMAKKIFKAIMKRRKRKILGWDAKLMAALSKLFPKSAPRLVGWFLKKAKSPLFQEVFTE